MSAPARCEISRESAWQCADLGVSSGGTLTATTLRGASLSEPPAIANLPSLHALRYELAPGAATLVIATPEVQIVDGSYWLEYVLSPAAGDLDRRAGAGVCIDLVFSDGTRSSSLGLRDQHGVEANPDAQAEAGTLHVEQWNYRAIDLAQCAARRVVAVELIARDPGGEKVAGFIDEIRVGSGRSLVPSLVAEIEDPQPADYVDTRRGSRSSPAYSRGNCFPATAHPRGAVLLTPVTDAATTDWFYTYDAPRDETGLPWLEAFSISHQPSPWMGDWGTFQFFPSLDTEGLPRMGRGERSLSFRHSREEARPYLYQVSFEQPLDVRIAPTRHGAMVEMEFPSEIGTVIFDNIDDRGTLEFDGAVARATSWTGGEHSTRPPHMHVEVQFETVPFEAQNVEVDGRSSVAGYARFRLGPDRTLRFRLGTSFVSSQVASRSVDEELPLSSDFGDISSASRALWNRELSVITAEGAREDQLATLYSSLYRLFLYPSNLTEQRPESSVPIHASVEGEGVRDGNLYVNNGFWDTYRTSWPAYALFRPSLAGELADGFLQHFRDYGWMPRWSSPGPANAMVGTNSDIIFADLASKGVTGFDQHLALEASLVNAEVAPPAPNLGRKSLQRSNYLQYTPDSVPESVSWSLENCLNDFGISVQLAALRDQTAGSESAISSDGVDSYFRSRAARYRHLYDPESGFFRGRDTRRVLQSEPFSPLEWGGAYTETNAWTMLFAVPHDVAGLIELMGGAERFESRLDEYFSTPESGDESLRGSYPMVIHEMLEARDVGLGMCGLSNQPAHHVPYLYAHTESPHKTGPIIRSALRRLFVGSEIGQGYLGDEDNGEMSAWFLFGAIGFYPLHVGTPFYVLSVPLLPRTTINLESGAQFLIEANVDSGHEYIQGAWLNGQTVERAFLLHSEIEAGGHLRLDLGPEPSEWGRATRDSLPSLDRRPLLEDLATADSVNGQFELGRLLVDDDGDTAVSIVGTVSLEFDLVSPREVQIYTVTASAGTMSSFGWTLSGATDDGSWEVLDERTDQEVGEATRLHPFVPNKRGRYSRYRFRFTATEPIELAEIELLSEVLGQGSPE